MTDRTKNKEKPTQEKEESLGYGNWLFRTKGTVAEPWPTAKELWEDPEVQKIIQAHNKSVKEKKRGTL